MLARRSLSNSSLRSNPALACQHNLTYWRNESYLGFGPGAHSSEGGWRWANIKPVAEYIERVGRYDPESAASLLDPDRAAAVDGRSGGWLDFAEQIDDRLAIGETMMLGLRLVREGWPTTASSSGTGHRC